MIREELRQQLRAIGFSDQEMDAIEERGRAATDAEKNRVVAWEFARRQLDGDALTEDEKDLLADELINGNY